MYETYTKQSLPSKKYRELLGTSLCVFNSNNSFIIENILANDFQGNYNWYDLIDSTSGELSRPIKETITKKSNTEISNLFTDIYQKRNRIVHSFQITLSNDNGNEQILSTKDKKHNQFHITEDYLMNFIKLNEELSLMLHEFRGY